MITERGVIEAGNGEIIASGEAYESKSHGERRESKSVPKKAAEAQVVDLTVS